MSGSQILLDTATVTTDAQAQLSTSSSRHTDATFTFTNSSASQGIYRIVTGSQNYTGLVARSPEITVGPNETKTVIAATLSSGTGYNFYLQRKEFGSWVQQGTKKILATKNIQDVNVSTSSKAAVVSWGKTHTAGYSVRLYDKSANSTQINAVTATLNTSTNKYEAVFTGLSNTINYRISIQTVEQNMNSSGRYYNQWRAVGGAEFTPSSLANLDVDAIFASYADLSWDDGDVGEDEEDGEAEFRVWRSDGGTGTNAVLIMDWTPDTTKTFTDTGLVPGTGYRYQLHRKGVDGAIVNQDTKEATTMKTELADGVPWSTVIQWSWAEVYEGAVTRHRLTPAGGETVTTPVSGTTVVLRNLTPDTSYTFEIVVIEKGEEVVVDTSVQKTDKPGVLSLQQAGYTTATFTVQSLATRSTTYYVANEDESIKSANISFDAGDVTKTVQLMGFNVNSTNKIFLKRAESGHWNIQSGGGLLDHISTTMQRLTAATSVASTSAMITWDQGYTNASYEVSLYDIPADPSTLPIQVKANGDIANTGGKRSAVFTGLSMETEYWGMITVQETNAAGVSEKMYIRPFNFDTSAGAVFQTGEVKASSVHLTWDAGEVGEADGVAEFMVLKQEVSVGTYTDATPWLPHTTSSFATISGLKPGVDYRFQLLRMRLDGGRAGQAILNVTTKTSVLTISGTASSHIQADWTELYPGAQYQLMYKSEGGTPVTFNDGTITETTALLTGLESSTTYVIELYVIEDGVAVGLATQALGSAASAKTGTSKVVVAAGVTVAAVAVGVVIFKMKAASAAKALLL